MQERAVEKDEADFNVHRDGRVTKSQRDAEYLLDCILLEKETAE